jgi:hypothetical protein
MTKATIIQTLKYLINFGASGLFAWSTYLSYALWVQPQIGQTRQESINLLKSGLIDRGLEHVLFELIVISVLTILTRLTQTKIEKQKRPKELFAITIVNILIAGIGLGLGILNAYNGLIIEIDRHF